MKTFSGTVIKDGEADLLLGVVLIGALTRAGKPEQGFESKAKQFALGVKIASARDDMVDLDSGEVQLLKEVVTAAYSPLIVGQVGLILEGKPTGIPVVEPKA